MYREKLKPLTIDMCPHRREVCFATRSETAICGMLQEVFAGEPTVCCTVARDACNVCCRSFPPSTACWNPVVASLIYDRAWKAVEAASATDLEGLRQMCERALDSLDVVYLEPLPPIEPNVDPMQPLVEVVPLPRIRHGATVRQWAVGVTTAPRLQSTLEPCLESMVRAGWETPHLFVDSAVRIPQKFSHLPGTLHDAKIGAWPNYYLALGELLLRQPFADAYLIAQDDILFYDRESLPPYLERVLWPGKTPGLVSLYCAPPYDARRRGWHAERDSRNTGPLAMVFPRDLAKAFITDAAVFEHRWLSDPKAATSVDDVVARWASDHGVPLWFPTPSLVQHIGDTSTLWPWGRALGHRRASRFAGDREKDGH